MKESRLKIVYYILLTAIAMCFIGHGAFGIITKKVWCNYFAVFGIGQELSYTLMPFVGGLDILLGLIMIIYPVRAIPLWLVFWGLLTASLRPLSGEPFAELIERAGNFGAPLAFLILTGFPKNIRELFTSVRASSIQYDTKTFSKLHFCLKVVVFLLLLGHGYLNLIGKKGLLDQYAALGYSDPASVAQVIGYAEIIAAFLVLIKPLAIFLLLFFVWKTASEMFYPSYGLFEWIERGGSYGAILALYVITVREMKVKWPLLKNSVLKT